MALPLPQSQSLLQPQLQPSLPPPYTNTVYPQPPLSQNAEIGIAPPSCQHEHIIINKIIRNVLRRAIRERKKIQKAQFTCSATYISGCNIHMYIPYNVYAPVYTSIHSPAWSGYTPISPTPRYVPSQPGYIPTQSGYVSTQPGFVPTQSEYVPTQSGYVPTQPGYVPTQPGYTPPPSGYVSAPYTS